MARGVVARETEWIPSWAEIRVVPEARYGIDTPTQVTLEVESLVGTTQFLPPTLSQATGVQFVSGPEPSGPLRLSPGERAKIVFRLRQTSPAPKAFASFAVGAIPDRVALRQVAESRFPAGSPERANFEVRFGKFPKKQVLSARWIPLATREDGVQGASPRYKILYPLGPKLPFALPLPEGAKKRMTYLDRWEALTDGQRAALSRRGYSPTPREFYQRVFEALEKGQPVPVGMMRRLKSEEGLANPALEERRKLLEVLLLARGGERAKALERLQREFPGHRNPYLWTNLGTLSKINGKLVVAKDAWRRALEARPVLLATRQALLATD